jgi:hypothetical protein
MLEETLSCLEMAIPGLAQHLKGSMSHMSHGQYSPKMVDGHPIHNKDPNIMVLINPYEPLDD